MYNDLQRILSRPFETEEDQIIFRNTASNLFKLLLVNSISEKRLYPPHISKIKVIPDGSLQNVPFEALLVDSNTGEYLIEDCEISYTYSMSFESYNSSLPRESSTEAISFAPGIFNHDNLEPIPDSYTEVSNLSRHFTTQEFTKEEASKKNFLNHSSSSKIVHLATHANFSNDLQLAFYDSNLKDYELYTSRNQAELVVLSACNTTLGNTAEGEGVMSLARGFFYAGANTIVSSLWRANDKSTAQIMKSFYENLSYNNSKSKSLHEAKLKFLKNASLSQASPFYWASFILIGDDKIILASTPKNNYALLTAVVFFLLLVLIRILLPIINSSGNKK